MSEPQKSGRGGGRGSLQKLVNELQRAPGTTQEPHETPSSSVETLQVQLMNKYSIKLSHLIFTGFIKLLHCFTNF